MVALIDVCNTNIIICLQQFRKTLEIVELSLDAYILLITVLFHETLHNTNYKVNWDMLFHPFIQFVAASSYTHINQSKAE